MEKITLNGVDFLARSMPTPNSIILAIRGHRGFLGCGYIDIATADRIGDACAIVCGVHDFDEMINAEVVRVSQAAAALGVQPGMTGMEALLKMQ